MYIFVPFRGKSHESPIECPWHEFGKPEVVSENVQAQSYEAVMKQELESGGKKSSLGTVEVYELHT